MPRFSGNRTILLDKTRKCPILIKQILKLFDNFQYLVYITYMEYETSIKIGEATLVELENGFREIEDGFVCIVCGERFERGVIYRVEERFMEPRRAAAEHVESAHGGMLRVLLALPQSLTGLSALQRKIIDGMGRGCSDREIAHELGGKAESTIRNHRFQFRKRWMEAKVMVAIAKILEKHEGDGERFIRFHKSMPIHDERTMTTQEEAEKILKRCMRRDGTLVMTKFPRKEKEKLVILKRIMEVFDPVRRYSEKEINALLQPIWEDYVTVRRYLIEYRFLGRKPDGSEYWVNE